MVAMNRKAENRLPVHHKVDSIEKYREKPLIPPNRTGTQVPGLLDGIDKKRKEVNDMAIVRNEKLIPMFEEKEIEWISNSGLWKIIGKVKPDINDPSFPCCTINIYRWHSDHRKFVPYQMGHSNNRDKMPKYILQKYNEIHDDIRGRKG